jgi:hypothetical protein
MLAGLLQNARGAPLNIGPLEKKEKCLLRDRLNPRQSRVLRVIDQMQQVMGEG